jgi:carbonic anhydrase
MNNNPNGIFKIEVHELNSESRIRVGSGIKVVDKTAEQVDQALDVARRVAGQAAQQLGAMGHRPDEMQLKLGLQFHFHGQSEHTIMGEANHLEAHFVHANAQGDRAVVGVMIKDGEENSFLASFMDNLPEQPGGLYPSASEFNPIAFLPEDQDYFTYPGSLTTPPCDENVTWFVMEHPVEASSAQILRLKDIMPKNYRPLAPLAGRQIRHYRD